MNGNNAWKAALRWLLKSERMLKRYTLGVHRVLCRTIVGAQGLTKGELVEGARRSTLDALAHAIATADKVLVF